MERVLESPGKVILESWKTPEFGLCKSWKKAFLCVYEPWNYVLVAFYQYRCFCCRCHLRRLRAVLVVDLRVCNPISWHHSFYPLPIYILSSLNNTFPVLEMFLSSKMNVLYKTFLNDVPFVTPPVGQFFVVGTRISRLLRAAHFDAVCSKTIYLHHGSVYCHFDKCCLPSFIRCCHKHSFILPDICCILRQNLIEIYA